MEHTEDYSHGSYGDYSGVAFYGPPTEGFWLDRLAVSDRYVHPLFCAILDRSSSGADEPDTPRLVREWNALEGWREAHRVIEVSCSDAVALIDALARVTVDDVAANCAGCTPAECLRCASAIRQFLGERLARGFTVFIESE